MAKNTGITMVSLVVTIIVLIILAGVSLNMTIGENGMITQAQKARENIELARVKEEEQLNSLYKELESNGEGIWDDSYIDAIEKLENFKKIIATAITNEGVSTLETDTVETMADNIEKILQERTKNATATAEDILEGKTAWVNGNLVIGTRAKNSGVLYWISPSNASSNDETHLTPITYSVNVSSQIPEYQEITADDFMAFYVTLFARSTQRYEDAGDCVYLGKPSVSYDASTGQLTVTSGHANTLNVWVSGTQVVVFYLPS